MKDDISIKSLCMKKKDNSKANPSRFIKNYKNRLIVLHPSNKEGKNMHSNNGSINIEDNPI